jgi:hypothetical protein
MKHTAPAAGLTPEHGQDDSRAATTRCGELAALQDMKRAQQHCLQIGSWPLFTLSTITVTLTSSAHPLNTGPPAPPVCHPHLHPEGGCHLLISPQAHIHPCPALGSSSAAHGEQPGSCVWCPQLGARPLAMLTPVLNSSMTSR